MTNIELLDACVRNNWNLFDRAKAEKDSGAVGVIQALYRQPLFLWAVKSDYRKTAGW